MFFHAPKNAARAPVRPPQSPLHVAHVRPLRHTALCVIRLKCRVRFKGFLNVTCKSTGRNESAPHSATRRDATARGGTRRDASRRVAESRFSLFSSRRASQMSNAFPPRYINRIDCNNECIVRDVRLTRNSTMRSVTCISICRRLKSSLLFHPLFHACIYL